MQLKRAAQKEREDIDQLRPVEEKPNVVHNLLEDDEGKEDEQKNGKNFWREMERVKVKGDLNKTEYQKIKIPLESLVPTSE